MYENSDKAIIREYLNEGKRPAGEPIIVKVWLSTVAGDPTKGIATTFNWRLDSDYATILEIQQKDIVTTGGIYQIGDIAVQMTRQLQPLDDNAGKVGDRIIWRGHEYRQIGNIDTDYLMGTILYNYVFRRV